MENHLSSSPPAIHYQTIPVFHQPSLSGHLVGYVNQVSSKVALLLCKVGYCGYVLPGYHQEVCRCLGIDIPQDEDPVILIEYSGWYLTSHYITENTILFHLPRGLESQFAGNLLPVVVSITEEGLGRFTASEVELHIMV